MLTLFSHNPLRAAGVKKLREIRGLEEVNVGQGDMAVKRNCVKTFTEEDVRSFERVLREELCRAKEEVVEVVDEIVVEEEE